MVGLRTTTVINIVSQSGNRSGYVIVRAGDIRVLEKSFSSMEEAKTILKEIEQVNIRAKELSKLR